EFFEHAAPALSPAVYAPPCNCLSARWISGSRSFSPPVMFSSADSRSRRASSSQLCRILIFSSRGSLDSTTSRGLENALEGSSMAFSLSVVAMCFCPLLCCDRPQHPYGLLVKGHPPHQKIMGHHVAEIVAFMRSIAHVAHHCFMIGDQLLQHLLRRAQAQLFGQDRCPR